MRRQLLGKEYVWIQGNLAFTAHDVEKARERYKRLTKKSRRK